MAIWSQETYLMHKVKGASGAYAKLVDIKDFPDLGSEPETIETTTLSETAMRTYIKGLQDPGSLAFTANYTKDDYDDVKAVADAGEADFAIFFGVNGENGAFKWSGELSVWVTGKGVNEVKEMSLSITPSTEIEPYIPTP